jgi:uncharacterized membrane protein
MSFEPLFSASPIIQVHVAAAIAAFGLGGAVLLGKKGTPAHRLLGRIWVIVMAITAVSSLFIWTIRMWGPFSPIHILSVATLVGLWKAVGYARARNISAHRRLMHMLYFGALIGAGWFTFWPGRLMNHMVFGTNGADPFEIAVFFAASAAAVLAFYLLFRKRLGWGLPFRRKPA